MKATALTFTDEYIPTVEDAKKAESVMRNVSHFDGKNKASNFEFTLVLQNNSRNLQLPSHFMPFLMGVLNEIAHGNAVTLVPSNKEFTTQEAADILNVSRPFIIKVLESGEIPFYKIGTHRRIRAKDLMSFKKKLKEKSENALDELSKMAQEDKLGYEE